MQWTHFDVKIHARTQIASLTQKGKNKTETWWTIGVGSSRKTISTEQSPVRSSGMEENCQLGCGEICANQLKSRP